MRIQLAHVFPVPAAPNEVIDHLREVGSVLSCVPGAHLGTQLEDGEYEAGIIITVETVQVPFSGSMKVDYVDAARQVILRARGRDESGQTKARVELTLSVASANGDQESSSVMALGGFVEMMGALAGVAAVGGHVIADGLLHSFASCFVARFAD